ncbi:MAG: hypothetical protein GY710_24455, partial [Desulfobacteraceae bacterium]|nr:hypothetical protein [Desulfobacteraceae bacterium]
ENRWLCFSFFGFLILPWVSILIMAPQTLNILSHLDHKILLIMVGGGILFGLGQIFFSLAFKHIGIGLNFVINISMGTAGSALIPILWHRDVMGTLYSYIQLFGVLIFIVAVIFGAVAGAARDVARSNSSPNKLKEGYLLVGVLFAVLAGVGSVCQGLSYIYVNPIVSNLAINLFKVESLPANTIAWVIIFSGAWIPYVLYFLYLNIKRKSLGKIKTAKTGIYWFYLLLMGIGFWGSLILFSAASAEIGGSFAPTIIWPLFMVFIILTSNFWSFVSGEWKDAGSTAIKKMSFSILLFIFAIFVFSFSTTKQPTEKHPAKLQHFVSYKDLKHSEYPIGHPKSGK